MSELFSRKIAFKFHATSHKPSIGSSRKKIRRDRFRARTTFASCVHKKTIAYHKTLPRAIKEGGRGRANERTGYKEGIKIVGRSGLVGVKLPS